MKTEVSLEERFEGCFLGAAIGDALGAPIETLKPGVFEKITNFSAPHPKTFWSKQPVALKPGDWTDDTAMTLCLADSLIACGSHNPADQLARYERWLNHGENSCLGVACGSGGTTREVIARYVACKGDLSGVADHGRPTNGGLMRLSPVALWAHENLDWAIELSAATSSVTHAHPDCALAAKLIGLMVAASVAGDKSKAFDRALWKTHIPNLPEFFLESPVSVPVLEKTNAYTAMTTARVALHCVESTDNFRDAILMAVNFGNDCDTYGAVAGAIAGTLYGVDAIPADWRKNVAWSETISLRAKQLYALTIQHKGPTINHGMNI